MYAYCAHNLVMRDKKNEKQWRKLPMTTAQIALSVIMIVASLFLIVVVLLQHGAQQGLGAVSGSADTFYGSGKASASDRIFARLTSIVGVVFVIIAIVLNLMPLRCRRFSDWPPAAVCRVRRADSPQQIRLWHDLRTQ